MLTTIPAAWTLPPDQVRQALTTSLDTQSPVTILSWTATGVRVDRVIVRRCEEGRVGTSRPGSDTIRQIPQAQIIAAFARREPVPVAWDGLQVTCHAQAAVEMGRVDADALISITGVSGDAAPLLLPPQLRNRPLLRLAFDDTAAPVLDSRPCRQDQLAEMLGFARAQAATGARRLAIHCFAGRSRSAAVALGVLADLLGPGREADAVELLLGQDDSGAHIMPQPGLVAMIDQTLGRASRLEAALEERSPAYCHHVDVWIRRVGHLLTRNPEAAASPFAALVRRHRAATAAFDASLQGGTSGLDIIKGMSL